MVKDADLRSWFHGHVLPLEAPLTAYLRRNVADEQDIADLRQDVYAMVLRGAARELPYNARAYIFIVAKNALINRARRSRVISFDQVADIEKLDVDVDIDFTHRHLEARDALRRAADGMAMLPPRCREVVRLRKVEGLSTREAADRLGVGIDTIERQLVLGLRAMTDFMLGGTGKIRRSPQRSSSGNSGRGSR